MSTEIESSKLSPRYENNRWYWFFGDTFTINWHLTIKKDGVDYIMTSSDKVVFNFYQGCRLVNSFNCINVENNNCLLQFTEDISKKFIIGDYTFSAQFYENYADTAAVKITTIGDNYNLTVEASH